MEQVEQRLVKLEVFMDETRKDVSTLELSSRALTGKLDKVIYCLMALLLATNPLTSGLIFRELNPEMGQAAPQAKPNARTK